MDGGGGDGGGAAYNPHTVEEVFRDFKGRRNGMIKALTTDDQGFYRLCDPGWLYDDDIFVLVDHCQVTGNGWAEGECKGKAGWFPYEYIKRLNEFLLAKSLKSFEKIKGNIVPPFAGYGIELLL